MKLPHGDKLHTFWVGIHLSIFAANEILFVFLFRCLCDVSAFLGGLGAVGSRSDSLSELWGEGIISGIFRIACLHASRCWTCSFCRKSSRLDCCEGSASAPSLRAVGGLIIQEGWELIVTSIWAGSGSPAAILAKRKDTSNENLSEGLIIGITRNNKDLRQKLVSKIHMSYRKVHNLHGHDKMYVNFVCTYNINNLVLYMINSTPKALA